MTFTDEDLKMKRVHMIIPRANTDDLRYCGIRWVDINATLDWKCVTCKNCLKKREAAGK